MDRREAAKWQIRQCRKDILLQAITAVAAIIIAAILLISAAHSEALDIRVGRAPGFESCAGGTCIHGDLPAASGPQIIHVPQPTAQAEQDAADKREHEWLNVCDPTFHRDSFGVEHYVYKKSGCEFGSPE